MARKGVVVAKPTAVKLACDASHGRAHKLHACPAVSEACKTLSAAKKETKHYTAGLLAYGGLLFAAGAAAWSLPLLFLLFAFISLPWRSISFIRQKWVFYLIDFCYFVNVATVIFLLWFPNDSRVGTLVYALADGPLAGALVAWQCPWVFGSAEHTVSVLMHLLPGLAVFAHRHHTPSGLRGWQGIATSAVGMLHGHFRPAGTVPVATAPDNLWLWLVVAPLMFYIAWQALYFLVVQVLCRDFILRNGYETSYICLARRAAKTNNFWNRLVRRGSISRRLALYGGLQLLFTIICCTLFVPTYFSYPLAFVYQVVKVVFPVYYGSRYQMTKFPQHAFLKGMQVYHAVQSDMQQAQQLQADAEAAAAAAAAKGAAARQKKAAAGNVVRLRACALDAQDAMCPCPPMAAMPRPVLA